MLNLRSMLSRLTIRPAIFYQPLQCIHLSEVDLRARKGTREKRDKLKKKIKAEKLARITKVGSIPANRRKLNRVDKHENDDWKFPPTDNAYPTCYYRTPRIRVTDAIQFHKELHHPTMLDAPNVSLNMAVEMDMEGDKPTRLVSNFQKLVNIQHTFDHGQKHSILVFAKEEAQWNDALQAGATVAGGSDLVRSALKGNVRFSEYQFILAHPDIMPELLALRGLLKKKFPSPKTETLGLDLPALVSKFMGGIFITGKRDDHQDNFGLVETSIGRLNMPTEHLVDNFTSIITTINRIRPNRGGKFITRVFFKTPVSDESFLIDPLDFPFEDYERPRAPKKEPPRKKKKQSITTFARTYSLFRTPV